jgi:HK97 family phage portal protein
MPLEAVNDSTTPPTTITPAPTIIRAPLGDARATNFTTQDWIEPLLRDLALWGNYLAVLGNVDWTGWPTQLFPVAVGLWSVEVRNGFRVYHVGDLEYDASEVLHVKINARDGELVGRGLMNTNRDTLAAAIAAERWAATYFSTGAGPSVHIAHPNPDLTQDQASDLKQKFLDSQAGSRQPVVTPVGTEITVLPNDAESAQLVEARKWANQALAMALGVQPAMLGLEGPSMTYRNITEVNQQTINTTVMRYLVPVEQALSAQCLPRGTRARFATSALVRPDLGERITQATAALQAGIIDVQEARAWLDLQPNETVQQPVEVPALAAPPAQDVPALQVVGGQ